MVYDENQEVDLLGLEKTYKVSEGVLEGEKSQLSSVLPKPEGKAVLGLRPVLQPEGSECVQGALDQKEDYVLEWVTQGQCPEEVLADSATPLAPRSVVLNVIPLFRSDGVSKLSVASTI